MVAKDIFETEFAKIETLAGRGEVFAAIDESETYIAKYQSTGKTPPSKLCHLVVLLMARAGALQGAVQRYKDLKLDSEPDIESRSLRARLLKDLAYASAPKERDVALRRAQKAYAEIYIQTRDSYPGINAATLAALIGDIQDAQKIANEIITAMSGSEDDRFWHYATLAEAHILAGDISSAKQDLHMAAGCAEISLLDKASTLKQLGKLLNVLKYDQEILNPLRPKTSLHYTGHMIAAPGQAGRVLNEHEDALQTRIKSTLEEINPGAAFGALASGSDILIAEQVLKMGADLHVVLPFAKDDFLETSVLPAGGDWAKRFQFCMEKARSVRYLTDQPYMGDDILFGLGAKLAMGLTVLQAGHIAGAVAQLAVWDKKPTDFPAGTAVDVSEWGGLGHAQYIVDVADLGREKPTASATVPSGSFTQADRVDAAMLFGDFAGFSKLGDKDLPAFVHQTLKIVADVFGAEGAQTDLNNTWGDGLFAVWPTPKMAAQSALALQEALCDDVQRHLPLRISLHYGVMHRMFDPVLKTPNYFGEAVSRAARIEPITPTGAIYATETFAAMLMLDSEAAMGAEYVGTLNMAKNYGAFPLYRITRKVTDYLPDV